MKFGKMFWIPLFVALFFNGLTAGIALYMLLLGDAVTLPLLYTVYPIIIVSGVGGIASACITRLVLAFAEE